MWSDWSSVCLAVSCYARGFYLVSGLGGDRFVVDHERTERSSFMRVHVQILSGDIPYFRLVRPTTYFFDIL